VGSEEDVKASLESVRKRKISVPAGDQTPIVYGNISLISVFAHSSFHHSCVKSVALEISIHGSYFFTKTNLVHLFEIRPSHEKFESFSTKNNFGGHEEMFDCFPAIFLLQLSQNCDEIR
jgi:hypothetical protein